jgi:predicted dinucleotide-utilizing enzyme
MWRAAVDEVVPAAVGLVGDDDDVAPVRKHGIAVAQLGGHELLDRREDDATAADAKLLAQVGAVGGLDRILSQQVATAGEGAEELVVQVVSVGDDDDRRVHHRRIEDEANAYPQTCADSVS